MIFGRGFPLQCFPFPHKKKRPFACLNQQKSFSLPLQSNILQSMKDKTLHLISIHISRVQHIPGPRTKFQLKQQPEAPTHGRPRRTPSGFRTRASPINMWNGGQTLHGLMKTTCDAVPPSWARTTLTWYAHPSNRTCPSWTEKCNEGTIDTLQMRVNMFKWVKPDVKLMINCDAPFMSTYYTDENGANAAHWAEIIDLSTQYYQDAGYEVVSVAPFNEPDYLYNNQGSPNEAKRKAEFAAIITELKQKERFNNIRMCGGNTLNSDQALPWYNYLKDQLDEGTRTNWPEVSTTSPNSSPR